MNVNNGKQTKAPVAAKAEAQAPAVARLGNLAGARVFFGRRDLARAWETTLNTIRPRPFHPEAVMLLAEIAQAAGDAALARQCAQCARDLAPKWNAPRQFLKKPLKDDAHHDWLKLPDDLGSSLALRLSVCVIAKNEERFLDQCLRSVKSVANQIVVVDTGSTDRTIEIAKSHGAEVHSFEWCDDFSAARNAALEHATGDWILMLDADEELPHDQRDALRRDLAKADAIAYRLPLINQGRENEGQSYVPRLFRNAPGVYYHGRVHEQVFPSLLPLCKAWGFQTGLGSAQLLHHGYAPDVIESRQKVERNLRLLRQAVEEWPNDVNLTMNLGLELIHSGDFAGGIEKYRDALRMMSAQSAADVVPELREVLLTQFAAHLYKQREFAEIGRVLNSPLAKNGGLTASLHFALGLACFESKQYCDAAEQMRQCIGKRHEPALSPVNTDIHTAAPYHCLAISLARTGDAAGAEKAFQAAFQETGRIDDVRLDYARWLAEQKRTVDALHALYAIIETNVKHAGAWRFGGEVALSQPEFLEFARDWTGEALRFLADDPVIVAQRAETLLLSEDLENAAVLWKQVCNGSHPPRGLAALIICAAESESFPPTNGAEETAVSRAFLEWYQRLIAAGARTTILKLNSRVEALRETLPTAARLLESAMAEAGKAA